MTFLPAWSLLPQLSNDVSLFTVVGYAGTGLLGYGVYQFLKRYVKWCGTPLRHLPGPKGGFWFGSFVQIQKEPFMAPHKRWMAEATAASGTEKTPPLLHYTTMFGSSNVLVLDKDIIRQILTAPYGKKDCRFTKQLAFIENIIGKGLLTLEGEEWMRHRRLVQPAFHPGTLKGALDETVPAKVNELIAYWSVAEGREIHVQSHFSALTLDIIGPVAFAHECRGLQAVREWSERSGDDQEGEAQVNDPFLTIFAKVFKFDAFMTFCVVFNLLSLDNMRKRNIDARNLLNGEVDAIIANAAADSSSKNTTTVKAKSLLSVLLKAHDPEDGLTQVELRDEVKIFMLAGHETTSTWCYWASYCLAKHPEIQEKLYAEIVKIAPPSVEKIGVDHVDQMPYLNGFLQEVLRLYPPAGFFSRTNTGPETLGGVTIPAGTRLGISAHILQRHPKYWDDPNTFIPERWINVSEAEAERRRFAYFPFSAGGRSCIGARFATCEAQLIVAALVRAFRIEIAPSQKDTEHTFTTRITMKAKPAISIVVHKRS